MFRSRTQLLELIARLRIPESRRASVEVELIDHLESRIEVELACGVSAAEAELRALESLGDAEVLRASLEAIEPAFSLQVARSAGTAIASAGMTAVLFGVAEYLLPAATTLIGDLSRNALVALAGLPILWKLAPPGLKALMESELRGTANNSQPWFQWRMNPAVAGYWGGVIAAQFGLPLLLAVAGVIPEELFNRIVLPSIHIWGGFAFWALRVISRARDEKRRLDAHHAS